MRTALYDILFCVIQNRLNHAAFALTLAIFIPILIGIPYILLQSCC